jgi:hypothetical protein
MRQHLAAFVKRGLTKVEVRVMDNRDGEPVLHDRFLVVDGAVWFSGNSFNAIGQRESLIVKLPDPTAVIIRLDQIFKKESVDFETFSGPGGG